MLHIYFGNGKGKTTSSIGIAMRAAGYGRKILFVQFLKSEETGERKALRLIPNIELTPCPDKIKFVKFMTDEEKLMCKQDCRNIFDGSVRSVLTGKFDMVVFDEIFGAIENNMLTETELFDFLANAPKNIEIVLTGHNPSQRVLELADYATEMKKVVHPYDKGVGARMGIEY